MIIRMIKPRNKDSGNVVKRIQGGNRAPSAVAGEE
jgi:hypothetical protein